MRPIISRSFIKKSFSNRSFFKVTAFLLAAGALPATARADQYPGGRPIEMTVMFGAGSAADVTARYLADGMAKLLGVPVPVVNRTGGGGAIGYNYVSKQKPDGHSIIWNSNSISSTYHSGVLPFDYTAFDPVARVSLETPAIAVRADAPWKSLRELIAHAQSNPGKVRIVGYAGAGSGAVEQLNSYRTALDRAQAVASALTKAGIPSDKIQVEAAPQGENSGESRAEVLLEH